ncbi:MAG: hypothetical protein EB084_19495, partial [Proteobacteria bacterium]|nr:hypothetical protein [Pseudomonadota bacterium]
MADDDRDSLPWLQDERPSSTRGGSSAPPSRGQRAREGEDAPSSPARGAFRPFDGPPDASTVVASRDDLLRAVREYMAQRTAASAPRRKPRTHADESADEFNAAAPEAIAPPPTPLPEISEI